MQRADIYLKLEIELDEQDDARKLGHELCRQLLKTYGVRSAEVSNIVERE
ncbi:MAG TPA: hypothetical protein VFA28_10700 [Bryobacteraceae bacterium]|jgi:hypothetical protein|nr:hypothetical protein [Bryobacteraceae bacterium]